MRLLAPLLLLGVAGVTLARPNTGEITLEQICTTKACIDRGTYLEYMMNRTADPCQDFFQFTCGNFHKYSNIINTGEEGSTTVFGWLEKYTSNVLVDLLKAEVKPEDPVAFSHAHTLFNLCMDVDAIEKQGIASLQEKIQAAGGWPVLGNWKSDGWTLSNTELQLTKLGLGGHSFFKLTVLEMQGKRFLFLDDRGILPRYLLEDESSKSVQKHYSNMVEVAVLMGASREAAEKQMKEVLLLEKELVKARGESEMNLDEAELDGISDRYHYFEWVTYVNSTAGAVIELSEEEAVLISNNVYFNNLGEVITNSSKEVLANYMMWRTVAPIVTLLPTKFRAIGEKKDRDEECVDIVSARLSLATSAMFVRSYGEIKRRVGIIVDNLQHEMALLINETKWLDEDARSKAERKIEHMKKQVAYPEELLNKTLVDDFYQTLTFDRNNLLDAVLDIDNWNSKHAFKTLRDEVSNNDWKKFSESTRTINAVNKQDANRIDISAAILRNPFFDPDVPDSLNYGAIGAAVGHEIIHSYDNEGILFNWEGKQGESWHEEIMAIFNEKKECIIEQYGNYSDSRSNISLNGVKTQGENIADNGGFRLAYRAYKRMLGDRLEKYMPDLEMYNSDQMFMIGFGSVWCSEFTTEGIKHSVEEDEHVPNEFRVRGVLTNSPEFSQAFNCKKGDPMNPEHKCKVW